jgi:hypothetical protein
MPPTRSDTGGGGSPLDIKHLLDRDRHAMQWTKLLAAVPRLVGLMCVLASPLPPGDRNRVEPLVHLLNALNVCLDHLRG